MNGYMKTALVLAACYAAYKFSKNEIVQTAAVAVGAGVALKQVPVVKDYVA